MKKAKGVAITDGKNRYNEVFPFKTLINAYNAADPNGMPLNLNHDSTRMCGWSLLSGIYIEPGKAYVTNDSYIMENDDDARQLRELFEKYCNKKHIDAYKEKLDRLRELLGDHLSENAKVASVRGAAFEDKEILYRVFPDLKPTDRKDLYYIKNLDPVGPGLFRRGEYILFAHRFFRRNCALVNTLNVEFLSLLQSINNPNLITQIKLDSDLIGLYGTFEGISREYQYWWGPKFNNDLSSIENGVARFKNEAYDNLFTNIDFTEFGWYEQNGKKTLECEEVQDKENIIGEVNYFGCRYVHSFLNSETGLPTHLDGAIRAYTDEQLVERLDSSIDKCGRNTFYTKLWRIDGDMPIEMWKTLITQFYRDNRQVGEYFGGEDEVFNEIVENKKTIKEKDPIKQLIPVDYPKGNGIRCFYRKGNIIDTKGYDVNIKSNEYVLGANGSKQKVMELETITVLKRIKQKGYSARIPYTLVTQHEDLIFNFPIFCCNNIKVAAEVIEIVVEFCEIWISNGDDRLISFSIDFNHNDFSVRLSFSGNINDLCLCFNKTGTDSLRSCDYISWLIKLYEINNSFPSVNQDIKIYELLTDKYELHIPRRIIPSQYIDYNCNEDGSVQYRILIPKEMNEVIQNNHIDVSCGYNIEEVKCEKCHNNYRNCDCIKYLEDISTIFTKSKVVEWTWTNRHA